MKPRTLSQCSYEVVKGHWPFVLTENLVTDLAYGFRGKHVFRDRGKTLGELIGDTLTIFEGYASDGASPHICTIGKLRIGTPSHHKTAPGFFVHDFLYQFGRLECCPWTYEQADDVLFHLMRQHGSILAAPYLAAVSIFGGIHRRLTQRPSETIECLGGHKQ